MGIWINGLIFDLIVLSKLIVCRFWEMNSLEFKVGPKPDKRGENDINLDTGNHVSSS